MARDLYYEIDEKGTGYYIKDRNNALSVTHQFPPFIPHPRGTVEESAQAHIDRILRDEAEAEKERVTIEDLKKELEELKKINAEQDTMLAELAML